MDHLQLEVKKPAQNTIAWSLSGASFIKTNVLKQSKAKNLENRLGKIMYAIMPINAKLHQCFHARGLSHIT